MNFKKTVAIDISPLYDGNSCRGVGVYTDSLVDAVRQISPRYPDIIIRLTKNHQPHFKFDLIHYPFFDPFTLTLPKFSSPPYIISMHDLIPRQYPSQFPVGIKGEFKWLIQKYLAKKSKYIITISNSSKEVISRLLNFPQDRIKVTYLAADDRFKPRDPTSSELIQLKNKYHLPSKYILYTGDINWNKNIPSLVKACLSLDYPLVIVGSSAVKNVSSHPWNSNIIFLQKTASLPENKIILTGYVSDTEFPLFFNLATVYCQPSYAEGFGFPLVQAMQSGCPVCYSKADAVSEIVKHSGLEFDPFSIDNIKLSLSQMWQSQALRRKYIKMGLNRAKAFDWIKTAIQTIEIYRLALAE